MGVTLVSQGTRLAATLFVPEAAALPAPAVVLCHGALEWKENYFDYAACLAAAGFVTLAMDMRGHGQSEGPRFCLCYEQWATDVMSAIDYLAELPPVAKGPIGLVGLSSGGTAALLTAGRDRRVGAIVTMSGTICDLPVRPLDRLLLTVLWLVGTAKKALTGSDLRLSLLSRASASRNSVNPDVDERLRQHPLFQEAWGHFPMPGGWRFFFRDIRAKLPLVEAPTLVLHGQQDQLDPPSSAKKLYAALRCGKELHIIEGSGHLMHLDDKKDEVFGLTLGWLRHHLMPPARV